MTRVESNCCGPAHRWLWRRCCCCGPDWLAWPRPAQPVRAALVPSGAERAGSSGLCPRDGPCAVRLSRPIMARIPTTRPSGGTTPATWRHETGERFGYQLTFFRRALEPPARTERRAHRTGRTDQVYMAHFAAHRCRRGAASTPLSGSARGAAGLAGAQADPLSRLAGGLAGGRRPTRQDACACTAGPGDASASIWSCATCKGPVLQGEHGLQPERARAGQCLLLLQPDATGDRRAACSRRRDLRRQRL